MIGIDMTYTFETSLAQKYGVNEAVMLNNFIFWIAKNEANGRHFYDGRYWTYNSVAAMEKLYPFWSTSQIRTIIGSLVKQGVLMKGNYTEQKYDRTVWYAFTDEFRKSICQNSQMDLSEVANGFYENGKPITDNKPYIKPSINTDGKGKASRKKSQDSNGSSDKPFSYREALLAAGASAENVDRLLANRKAKRLKNNEAAYNKLMGAVEQVRKLYGVTTDEVIEFAGKHGWCYIDPSWREVENIRARAPRKMKMMTLEEMMKRDMEYFDKK